MKTESVWVLEKIGTGPAYLGDPKAAKHTQALAPLPGRIQVFWVFDINIAIWFRRKRDAEAVMRLWLQDVPVMVSEHTVEARSMGLNEAEEKLKDSDLDCGMDKNGKITFRKKSGGQ